MTVFIKAVILKRTLIPFASIPSSKQMLVCNTCILYQTQPGCIATSPYPFYYIYASVDALYVIITNTNVLQYTMNPFQA